MLVRITGALASVTGAAILTALHVAIYDHEASAVLVDLGIPGALLSTLAGLCLFFGGGAAALRRVHTAQIIRLEEWR
jgi:hypothetical protein